MTIDPTAVLSEGLDRLNELREAHLDAQQQVDDVRQQAAAHIAASKERANGAVEEEKSRHASAMAATKEAASAVVEEAKQTASRMISETKAEADSRLEAVRKQTAAEHSSAENEANTAVAHAVNEAEGPRAAYAAGIASLVGTGWATTASLATFGHRTPKRPKNLNSPEPEDSGEQVQATEGYSSEGDYAE